MAERRRRLYERRFTESNSVEDQARLMLERVRIGELTKTQIFWAAMCEHPAAMLVHPGITPVVNWMLAWDFVAESDLSLPTRVCYAAAKHVYPDWLLGQHPEYANGWVRQQGGTSEFSIDEPTRSIRATIRLDKYAIQGSIDLREYKHLEFEDHPMWGQMVHDLRKKMIQDGELHDTAIWAGLTTIQNYLEGKESRIGIEYFIKRLNNYDRQVSWFWHLMHVPWQDVVMNYNVCLRLCYRAIGPTLTQAINKEIAQWALS